jgi:hypothetical protein
MAKIISIPISGKVGLEVSMPGRYGQVRRAWVVPANPNTVAQLGVRGRLATVARRFDALTQSQQDAWSVAATSQMTRSRLGTSGPLTGLQLFVKVNATLLMFGMDQVDVPPALPQLAAAAPQNLVITNTGGTIALKLTVPTSPGQNTTLRASGSVPSGTRRVPSLRHLGMCPTPAQGSSDITSLYVAKYGAPTPGSRVFVTAAVMTNGYFGPVSTFSALVPASP